MRVCLIVPALNEAARIASVVQGGAKHVEAVYVVDDGSSDGTSDVALRAGAAVVRHETNMGKGVAIRSGIERAIADGYDAAITIDGDGQHDPADIPRFIERHRETGAHVVLGTRMSDVATMPIHRVWNNRLVSAVGQWLSNSVAPDFQCGYRFMLLEPLRTLALETRGYEMEAELLIRLGRGGYVIDSVPVATVYAGEVSHVRPLREMLRFTRLLFRTLASPARLRAPSPAPTPPRQRTPMFFLTNDDGIHATGIAYLEKAVQPLGDVWVVAPDRERSNISMAITIDKPLRAHRHGENRYAIDGTPVDCVDMAIGELLPETPALCLSGINMGQNLGHDVLFSGTVAAARKATFLGVPSIAFSMPWISGQRDVWHLETAESIVRNVVEETLRHGLPTGILLNVNIPNVPAEEVRGVRIARQDPAPYDSHVLTREDKWGEPYYWIGGKRLDAPNRHETDFGLLTEGYVTVTPLHADMTDDETMDRLRSWDLRA